MKHLSSFVHLPMGLQLEEWIDLCGLRDLEKQWKCHAEQFLDEEEDVKSLVRLMFISLRSDIQNGINTARASRPSKNHATRSSTK